MFEHSFLPCGYGYYLFSESCMNTVNVAMMRWLCGQMLLVFLLSDFLQGSLLADPANCSVTAQTPCKDKCIPITWLCNDQGDCPDGTDEQCDVACRGDENAWQCDNGKCISKRWKCDGVPDCLDGSDELDCVCSGNIQCHSSGKCIDRWEICNGKNDCEDGSDERNCPTYSCMENGVQCKNKVCVMKSWLCNGIDNCGDGSDEELCDDCAEAYKCSNGVCLNGSQICNRENDCPDGSDETRTCGHHCSLLNGECMHHCKDVPWGVICTCQEGWKLQPDRQNCADIDECSFDYNPCHQLCSNSNGSFLCDCVKGFELKGKTVCEVIGHATLMLVAKQGEIGLVDVRMADYQSLLTIDDKPSAIAYYLAKEAYLWITERKTLQVFFIGTVNTNALYPDVGDVSSLSVDWFTGQLYWASLQRKSISVGLIDGRGFINLFEKDIVPDQLVVFPDNRCMYWINYEKKGITTIESAGMDGSDRHVIVFLPMEEPIGLTLDRITWRLYWISKYKESIETIHVNGSGRHTFPDVLQKKQETLGLAVFEGWFFLADNTQLVSLSRNEPREKRLLLSTSNISSFTVLHELQQSTSASPCSSGTCSHLCLLSPVLSKSYKCACPAGLFLLPSGKCETLKIMCNSANSIHLVELGFQGAFVKKTFVRQEANLNLMDFDWKRDLIYWIDEHGLLKRSNESFGNLKVIHTGEAVCMAKVDIATGNIYWVPCQGKKICVTKHSGSGTKVIYLSSYIIQHLLLDWDTRLLYVVENGMSIQQMNLVGGDVQNLLNETNAIQQMSLDISSHSIMWKTEDFGLHTFGILKGKPSQLKDNFTSTLMDAFEPFILSYNDPFIEIWDRRTLKLFASVNETNLSKLVMVTSSHVRGKSLTFPSIRY
ncbi:very low-density lipoprotein receptor-like [Hyperolius riggenbachi]|uniref:very low-density lipoprotein receptor-like n=1 Tax=Hyperolius riggenbachi TaxID=752182 RepID=UPI0035A2C3F4